MNNPLQELLNRPDIWRASRGPATKDTASALPTGHAQLDAALHQGGWPRAALSEILTDHLGIGEMQLLLPTLAHCSRASRRLFLICPPHLPYAPALQAHDVQLERLLVLSPSHGRDSFWSAEQILHSGTCACLLAWLPETGPLCYQDLRRLQLAARASDSLVFLFRPLRAASTLSPASLRIRLNATAQELVLEILKQRGGWAGQRIALPRARNLLQERIIPSLLPVTVSVVAHDDPSVRLCEQSEVVPAGRQSPREHSAIASLRLQ